MILMIILIISLLVFLVVNALDRHLDIFANLCEPESKIFVVKKRRTLRVKFHYFSSHVRIAQCKNVTHSVLHCLVDTVIFSTVQLGAS